MRVTSAHFNQKCEIKRPDGKILRMDSLDFKKIHQFNNDARSMTSKGSKMRPKSSDNTAASKNRKMEQFKVIRQMLKNEKSATALLRE
jgi:hypothetical protein